MYECSLHEGAHPSREAQKVDIQVGIIERVDAKAHLCYVRPISNKSGCSPLPCQWLDIDSTGGYVPVSGTMGLVFVVDGTPYFWGAMRGMNPDGTTLNEDEKAAGAKTPGTKVFGTKGGASITVSSSGLVDIRASRSKVPDVQMLFYPADGKGKDPGLWYTKADMKEQQFKGGVDIWKVIDAAGNLRHTVEHRRDGTRTFVMFEETGYVDPTIMRRVVMGVATPAKKGVTLPVYEYTLKITGEMELITHAVPGVPGGFAAKIQPTGAFNITTGLPGTPQFSMDVAVTGDTKMEVNKIGSLAIDKVGNIDVTNKMATLHMGIDGTIEGKNKLASAMMNIMGAVQIKGAGGEVTMSPAGEVKINAMQKVVLEAKMGIDIKTLGAMINVESVGGPINVKGKLINIDGGTGATNGVLCNPLTLSPFTGSPLAPFSTTVKVSV